MRLSTLVEIARDNGFEMPEYEEETLRPFVQMMPYEPRTWQNFLGKFRMLRQFYLSVPIIRRIAEEAVIDAATDNIKYMELRFTPKALSNITKASYYDTIRWVCEAATDTAHDYDIDVRFIISMNRHEEVEIAEQVIEAAIAHMNVGVVGIDLAGVELGYPIYPFIDMLKRGRDAGLYITLHAGEWDGAHSIWDAISFAGANRIGHGIRAVEDAGVIEVLRENAIPLEVCPSSNVDSGVVTDYASHQLPLLWDAGVKVTLNTDDPLVSGITLTDELVRVVERLPFTIDDIKKMTINAAEAAFLPENERRRLIRYFQQALFLQN